MVVLTPSPEPGPHGQFSRTAQPFPAGFWVQLRVKFPLLPNPLPLSPLPPLRFLWGFFLFLLLSFYIKLAGVPSVAHDFNAHSEAHMP